MKKLLEKLTYKGQKRIVVINADENFYINLNEALDGVQIDTAIDPRYPYEFILIFVRKASEVRLYTPCALHNLVADGKLWFCYPKKTSMKYKSDIDRDHGWEPLSNAGLQGIRLVTIDEDWSAFRFRNVKYIKSSKL